MVDDTLTCLLSALKTESSYHGKFSSLATSDVMFITIYVDTSNDKFGTMTTQGFQLRVSKNPYGKVDLTSSVLLSQRRNGKISLNDKNHTLAYNNNITTNDFILEIRMTYEE